MDNIIDNNTSKNEIIYNFIFQKKFTSYVKFNSWKSQKVFLISLYFPNILPQMLKIRQRFI